MSLNYLQISNQIGQYEYSTRDSYLYIIEEMPSALRDGIYDSYSILNRGTKRNNYYFQIGKAITLHY